jgi:hypothetical protein
MTDKLEEHTNVTFRDRGTPVANALFGAMIARQVYKHWDGGTQIETEQMAQAIALASATVKLYEETVDWIEKTFAEDTK